MSAESALMGNYQRLPVRFVRGKGAWLWDDRDQAYLDAVAGIAVCGLGHAHPELAATLAEQAGRVVHTSNLYQVELQEQLAQALCSRTGMDNAFFANSGAEANEAAIKLARLHGRQKHIREPAIIVMEGSFHGRTLATLSATGNRRIQAGFEPLVQGFVRAPYNRLEALHTIARNNPNIVACMLEPVLGEGGVQVPDPDYLPKLRKLCDEQDWLMILDEVQTGNGRTGKLFAFQHHDFQPDVLTTAKGLGNGFPVSACLARGKSGQFFGPGSHATTFGGNPLACATALKVLEILEREKLSERAGQLGAQLLERLHEALQAVPQVVEIRGQGLMIGIELDHPCSELAQLALQQGLLINVTAQRVIRLLPPLIFTDQEAELLVNRLETLVKSHCQRLDAA